MVRTQLYFRNTLESFPFSFLFMFRELKHGCWNGFQAICMLCHPSIPITVFELDEFFTSSWLTTLFYDGGKNPFGAS